MRWGRVVLGGTVLATAGMVFVVHRNQKDERSRMFDGVLRDLERQEAKKKQHNATSGVQ